MDFSNVLAFCSGHARFQADSCSQSFRMSIKIFLKFRVGSCISRPVKHACSTVGVFSTVGDIMMHVGDILSTVGDLQYHGGYLEYHVGCSVPWWIS